jgi:hypothetical protein
MAIMMRSVSIILRLYEKTVEILKLFFTVSCVEKLK